MDGRKPRKVVRKRKHFVHRGKEYRTRKRLKISLFCGGEKRIRKRRKIFGEKKYVLIEEKENEENNWRRK